MFSNWYKKADTFIPHLEAWQEGALKRQLKKAYEAGRKQGREEAGELAQTTMIRRYSERG
jgi:flagellar biosynthesis/type III secretory pathway protein FliH